MEGKPALWCCLACFTAAAPQQSCRGRGVWAGGGRRQQLAAVPHVPQLRGSLCVLRLDVTEASCCPGLQHARQRDIMDVQTSLSGHSCGWSGILADCCGTWHHECGCSCSGDSDAVVWPVYPEASSFAIHGLGCGPPCGRAMPDMLAACHAAFSQRGAEVWRSGPSRFRSRGWDAQGRIGLASWRPGDSSAA